jgi:hypothetical protein
MIASLLAWLQNSHLAMAIVGSAYLFPVIESLHVIAVTIVFGTIILVDLRLLGVASTRVPFTKIASDALKWTWGAFGLAVITGSLLFITNADVYYHNFYFRSKMILLALAGLNMTVFEFTVYRSVRAWDFDQSAPPAGRAIAVVSLLIWVTVIFCGRWIGFSTQL